ncbi:unnamed protein product, partial [Onchocerca flexuosa]
MVLISLTKTSLRDVESIIKLERFMSTTCPLHKNSAGKYRTTSGRKQMLTYEMAHRPHHIGVKKSWLTWHSQNLETFRQRQPIVIAQDEIIRRF